MRKWNVVALCLAFGFIVSPIVTAQSNDDLRREVEQLKRDLTKVMTQNQRILAENADIRATTEDSSLEERINALAESLDYAAGTTVNSVANPVTLSGEFRVRGGWAFNRNFNDDDDSGSYQDARFRVAMDFDFSRDVTTHFEMQANGLYENDDTPSGNSSLSNIDLYQGWILTRNIFGRKELSAKTGRQEIVLGNEFIFGDNDFFSGETFDGSHWLWASDNFDIHLIIAKMAVNNTLNVRNHPYTSVGAGQRFGYDDDELYAVYFTLKSIENMVIDFFWVYIHGDNSGSSTGTQGNSVAPGKAEWHTVGLSWRGGFDVAEGLDYALNFAYQFGDFDSATTANGLPDNVDGIGVEVEVGLTFNADNNFRIFLRFLWSEGRDGNDSGFVPLFMETHSNTGYRARYGIMDIIPVTNVLTLQAGLHFDPNADWTLGATFIWAQTDEDVTVAGNSEDGLGWEIDVWAEYRYSAETTISAGIGVFFPDNATPTVGGVAGNDDDTAFMFYLQTRVIF